MWDGMFAPQMRKSIGSVRFVPLEQMTPEDLRILEHENLRNKAKNRIADLILSGELVGFFHVNIVEKRRSKPNYYWPVTKKEVEEFQGNARDRIDEKEVARTLFRHEPEDEELTQPAQDIEYLIYSISLLSVVRLAALILKIYESATDEEKQKLSEMQAEDERYTREDVIFLVTVILLRHFTYEKALDIIERV